MTQTAGQGLSRQPGQMLPQEEALMGRGSQGC